jgi:hypothetical protein
MSSHKPPKRLFVAFDSDDSIGRCKSLPDAPAILVDAAQLHGAATSTVRFEDITRRLFHWQATKRHDSGVKKVYRNYTGEAAYAAPCPPTGERHVYRLSIEAYDAGSHLIGHGWKDYDLSRSV